jgi:hypothetical protein
MSQDEAADQLGLPRGTLKRRLELGRNKLRERLAGRGLGLSALLLAVMLSERKLFAFMPPKLILKTVHNAVAGRLVWAATGAVSSRAALLAGSMSVLTLGLKMKAVVALLLLSSVLAVPIYHALPATANAGQTTRKPTISDTPASQLSNESNSAPAVPAAPGDFPARQPPLKGPRPHNVM